MGVRGDRDRKGERSVAGREKLSFVRKNWGTKSDGDKVTGKGANEQVQRGHEKHVRKEDCELRGSI